MTYLKGSARRIARAAKRFVSGPPKPPLGRVTPTGDTYYGEKAETYLQSRQETENWRREDEVMRRLLDTLPDGLAVLDVPFGTGRFVPHYLAKGMTVHGLEASASMLTQASRYLGDDYAACHVSIGDARALPYEAESFDLVVCFRFLNQIVSFDDAQTILRELRRVTRSAAFLQLKARQDRVPPVPLPGPGEMMSDRLYQADLERILESAGFSVDRVTTITSDKNLRLAYLVRKA
jgi:ubiquinone/menaquinone biosynthesis C-methylase UbiE